MRGGVPGELLLHNGRRGGAAFEGSVHRLRLLLLRLPIRCAAVSQGRQLRFSRQDGQVHLLRRRPGGRRLDGGVREVRLQPSCRRQAAALRRDALDQVAARRRWRHHRADLQGARDAARLRLRRVGLADGVPRTHCDVTRASIRALGVQVMSGLFRLTRFIAMLAIIGFIVVETPGNAQQGGLVNPTASAVNEEKLLRELQRVEGRITIPDQKERVLIQPEGRTWRYFHEVVLHWFGTIVILLTIVLLAIAYFILGPIRLESGRSGRKVPRFGPFERFVHWMTAISFILLGLTGLNVTFGKRLLLPLMGPDLFSR